MRKSLFVIGILAISLIFVDGAQAVMTGEGAMGPYGGYCRGPKWGWYGAGKMVRTAEEVRALVADYFKGTDLTVGEVIERKHFFEVWILDAAGRETLDVLVIDKRNCRIRSKY